ncbi:hypothetical protein MKW94_009121 [Papaver nudicaule]|uniref:Uncharacterized protein n=1 Tax=Papaver nudicaule TaxID=74823 RepID=A0AA41S943_PAPNU|nr:hypothetical protein [Papaver nudicaule]
MIRFLETSLTSIHTNPLNFTILCQDFRQSPDVEQKQSEQIERLSKLVEEQQRKIDQLAAGKSFSLQDVISLADSRRKEKTNKYKGMYVDAQEKV